MYSPFTAIRAMNLSRFRKPLASLFVITVHHAIYFYVSIYIGSMLLDSLSIYVKRRIKNLKRNFKNDKLKRIKCVNLRD